jgi:SAM-dependent methyltransferase
MCFIRVCRRRAAVGPIERCEVATEMQLTKTELAAFIEWDVRNWSSALDFWLAHTTQKISTCSALELGTRNGGLSLWMALQGARVVSSDVALPGQTALEMHQNHGVSHLVQYEAINATNIPYTMSFDVVMFKSVLGAIGRFGGKQGQSNAVKEMHKALKKDGELFFAENLIGCWAHQLLREKFVRRGNTWRYVSIEEMEEFLRPFSEVHYRTFGFIGALGRSELQRNVLSILDKSVFNVAVPDRWKYIIVGVAKK